MVAYLQKSEGSEGFHQIIDFLTTSHISATIDGKVKVVSEASIRRHLKLEDSDGISDLPTIEIFKQLALMGETEVPQPSSLTQNHVANEAASTGVDVRHGGAATSVSSLDARQGSGAQTQGRHDHEMEADFEFTTAEDVSTVNVPVNTVGAEISTASPKVKTACVSVDDVAAEGLVYIRKSAAKRKDMGKAIMEESEATQTKTKITQYKKGLGLKKLKDYKNNLMKKRGKGLPVFMKKQGKLEID
ncbi:hypothetical protein Tco_0951142 [Tanacetum coccineum]|uniref:Uncharacterized protein n=1 Tax=Tanacetum coccineum TaxID=301880 RepID=A0ABQ5DU00_9ASTR